MLFRSSVISPNPSDLVQKKVEAVGTDIWMLNLDNYTYIERGASNYGSMSLPFSQKLILHSGQVSIRAEATNVNSVLVTIDRNINRVPNKPLLSPISSWMTPDSSILSADYLLNTNGVEEFEIKRAEERLLLSDRKSTRLNSSHVSESRMPSSA